MRMHPGAVRFLQVHLKNEGMAFRKKVTGIPRLLLVATRADAGPEKYTIKRFFIKFFGVIQSPNEYTYRFYTKNTDNRKVLYKW